MHAGFWWGNLARDCLEDPGLDGRIILKRALKTWNGGCGLDWSVSGQGQVAGLWACDNELSGSIRCRGLF